MVCLLKHGQFSWPTRGYVGSARHVRYDLIAAGSPRCLVWRWDLWPESAGLGRCLKLGLRWCQLFRKHLVGIAGFFIFLNMWCDMCGSLWRFPEMPVPPVTSQLLGVPPCMEPYHLVIFRSPVPTPNRHPPVMTELRRLLCGDRRKREWGDSIRPWFGRGVWRLTVRGRFKYNYYMYIYT